MSKKIIRQGRMMIRGADGRYRLPINAVAEQSAQEQAEALKTAAEALGRQLQQKAKDAAAGVPESYSNLDALVKENAKTFAAFRTGREKKWNDSDFYVIDYDRYESERHDRFRIEGGALLSDEVGGFTAIHECPRFLCFRLTSEEARLYLYIGTMEDGVFVPDPKYQFMQTDTGYVNYLNSYYSQGIQVEPGHCFYYRKAADPEHIALIGAEEFHSDLAPCYTPYTPNRDTLKLNGTVWGNSILLPAGCDYAVITDNPRAVRIAVGWPDETDEHRDSFAGCEFTVFGHVPEDAPVTLLTHSLTSGGKPNSYDDFRVYIHCPALQTPAGAARRSAQLGQALAQFRWRPAVSRLAHWAHSTVPFVDKEYMGVPYAGRWINSHTPGYEISLFTLASAMADPYGIFYDDGTVSGHSEINAEKGGPGYGLVCSTFASLLMGSRYPQSNKGMTWDDNYRISVDSGVQCGEFYMNRNIDHVLFVNARYPSGVDTLEQNAPLTAHVLRTAAEGFRMMRSRVQERYLEDFVYRVSSRERSFGNPLLNTDFTLTRGKVRPWRGNKSVYGPWELSPAGSGIGVTVQDAELTRFFVADPTGAVHTVTVTPGTTYADISHLVTGSGTYAVYAQDSDAEFFRYYDHAPVTMTLSPDGTCSFSAPDVAYVYAQVRGDGLGIKEDVGAMVFAAGSRYPALYDGSRENGLSARIVGFNGAVIRDPAADCWGAYTAVCQTVKDQQPEKPEEVEAGDDA